MRVNSALKTILPAVCTAHRHLEDCYELVCSSTRLVTQVGFSARSLINYDHVFIYSVGVLFSSRSVERSLLLERLALLYARSSCSHSFQASVDHTLLDYYYHYPVLQQATGRRTQARVWIVCAKLIFSSGFNLT